MSRKSGRQQVGVALFPFLAVLICTMGALIVLLVLLVQQARVDASTVAVAQVGGGQAGDNSELRRRLEDAQWQREVLEKSRAEKAEELTNARARVAHLEEHIHRLEAQAKELLDRARAIDEGKKLRSEDLAAAREQAKRLKEDIEKKKKELDEAKKKAGDGQEWYALIPYDGRSGTRRRPIYVECTEFGVIIQPEGILLKAEDFAALGPGNPLDSALRAIREHYERTAGAKAAQPYPLLVVRPSGVYAFDAARMAIRAWDDEWGYELISDEKQLDFGPPDPALNEMLNKTVSVARQRQAAIVAMMPRTYQRQEQLTSFAPEPKTSSGGPRSVGTGNGAGGGGLGGNSTAGGLAGNGSPGRSGGDGTGGGYGVGTGNGPGGSGYASGGYAGTQARSASEGPGSGYGVGTGYGNGGAAAGGNAGGPGGAYAGMPGGAGGYGNGPAGSSGYGNAAPGAGGYGNGAAGAPAYGNGAPGGSGSANGGAGGTTYGTGNNNGGANGASGSYGSGGSGSGAAGAVGFASASGGSGNGTSGGGAGGTSGVAAFPNSPLNGTGGGNGGVGGSGTSDGNGGPALGSPTDQQFSGGSGSGGSAGATGGATGQRGSNSPGQYAAAGAGSAGQGGSSAAGGGSFQSGGSSSGGSSSSASSSSMISGGGGQSGGSPFGGSSMMGGSQGGMGVPSLNFGQSQPQFADSSSASSSKSGGGPKSTAKRGANWALPAAKVHHTGVTRPIQINLQPDRVVLLPERGDNRGPQTVKVAPELSPDDVDHVVAAVQNEVKGWGLAVAEGYWKPVLQANVAPGAERHFENLQTALKGSGIEIVRK